ncbi:hypothetical protein TNCT_393031 [Trichonephila clavata]|uniref:Integrase zinc-binding domain-containing protein n=1 Tax=Trichonephila clavata TaxID=2740835 RepID=A0A8X6L562_TRICU|nr:hypothetical protein TNCT_393031 [Trichonephila clavata]
MAWEQFGDVGLHSELEKLKVEAKQITLESPSSVLCDTSTGVIRLIVPKTLRRKMFDVLHGNLHLWECATVNVIRKRYFWPSFRKDRASWKKSCLQC